MPRKTIAIASANSARYSAVRLPLSSIFSSLIISGSFFTNMMQHSVMSTTDNMNGGAIMPINSPLGILNLV